MAEPGLLYLSRADVESVGVPMTEVIAALERMFLEKGNGRVEMPPKPGIHTRPDAFIHAMPAYIPALLAAGMKWVSGYPENMARGLPYISGLLILNDPDTGAPIAVMDCTWITAKRTGAATAVAAKHLAREDSSSVGILGCGVQGRSNLEAIRALGYPLTIVKAFDVRPEAARRFAEEAWHKFNLEVEEVDTPYDAVKGLDIVVTSGPILKEPQPVIEAGWLAEGAFASPVDFDSYWTPEALAEVDLLATDDHGQMDYYRGEGYFRNTPKPYADLGELVSRKKRGRAGASQRTMAINLGLGLEDMATAIEVYKAAVKMGLGTRLPL